MDTNEAGDRWIWIGSFIKLGVFLIGLFLCAGRWDYWQGWMLTGLVGAQAIASGLLFRKHPDLVRERIKPGPGIKWWDKIFYSLFIPFSLAVPVLAALDAGRYVWSPPLTLPAYAAAILLYLLSSTLIFWAMWTNRFFSSMVRIQKDRGQVVITGGPYRFVRHPGYIAGIVMMPAIALMLGSVWALIPSGLCALLFIIRTKLEDNVLLNELPGYREYSREVRYRLLPGMW